MTGPGDGANPSAEGAAGNGEAPRLSVLREAGLPEGGRDESFERLTRVARRALDVPAALLAVADGDRMVLVSRQGIDREEIAARDSMCGTVVTNGDSLAVEDARVRSEFADHELMEELGLVAFLGHPVTARGQVVGALCVFDAAPWAWTESDRALLGDLAATTSETVEGRLREREAEEAEQELAEARATVREVTDHIQDVVWMRTPDKDEMLYINAAYEDLTGRSQESLYRNPGSWLDAIHPEDRNRVQEALSAQHEGRYDEHYRIQRPDGEIRWVHDRAFPVTDEDGEFRGRIVGVVRDVTDLKTSQIEHERRYHTLFEGALDPTFVVNPETGRMESANDAARECFGYTAEEIEGMHVTELAAPEERSRARAILQRARDEGEATFTIPCVTAEGERVVGEVRAVRVTLPDGDRLYAILRDVTEQERLKRDLRQKTRRLEEAQRVAEIGSWEWELDSGTVFWSDELYRLFGEELDAFEPSYEAFLDHVHPEDRERMDRIIRNAAERAEPFKADFRVVRPDGEVRWLQARGEAETDEDGETIRVTGTDQEVTERKQLLTRYRQIFESNAAGIALITDDGTITEANRAAADILGVSSTEDLEGDSIVPYYHNPSDRTELRSAVRSEGEVRNREISAERADGTPIRLMINLRVLDIGEPEKTIWVKTFVDVTELHHLRQRYRSLTRDVLSNARVGIVVLDAEDEVVWRNRRFAELVGDEGPDEGGSGKELAEYVARSSDDTREVRRRLLAARRERQSLEDLRFRIEAGGETRGLQCWGQPITSGGYAGGWIEFYAETTGPAEES